METLEILLTRNHSCLIDKADFEIIAKVKWYASTTRDGHIYAKNITKRKSVFMHRMIIGAAKGQIVDHKNGNTLDNRRSNLRFVTAAQNNMNQRARSGKKYSKSRGISYLISGKRQKRWTAALQVEGKKICLGYFLTEALAVGAYEAASLKYYGQYSDLKRMD